MSDSVDSRQPVFEPQSEDLPAISTATVALLYETGGRFLVPLYALLYLTAGVGVGFVLELVRKRWIALRRN